MPESFVDGSFKRIRCGQVLPTMNSVRALSAFTQRSVAALCVAVAFCKAVQPSGWLGPKLVR